jgi:hypothetical protein
MSLKRSEYTHFEHDHPFVNLCAALTFISAYCMHNALVSWIRNDLKPILSDIGFRGVQLEVKISLLTGKSVRASEVVSVREKLERLISDLRACDPEAHIPGAARLYASKANQLEAAAKLAWTWLDESRLPPISAADAGDLGIGAVIPCTEKPYIRIITTTLPRQSLAKLLAVRIKWPSPEHEHLPEPHDPERKYVDRLVTETRGNARLFSITSVYDVRDEHGRSLGLCIKPAYAGAAASGEWLVYRDGRCIWDPQGPYRRVMSLTAGARELARQEHKWISSGEKSRGYQQVDANLRFDSST